MVKKLLLIPSMVFALIAVNPALSQKVPLPETLHYADLADLSIDAPIIVHATIKKAIKVDPERSIGAPTGTQRFYIIATTNALIRGQDAIPDTIRYVIDMPLDARGRTAKIKKKQFILFAKPIAGRPADIQLAAKNAQIAWNPTVDARIRSLVREIVAQDAPPAIAGIANAFHVPGTIIGEGETQIFIETESRDPVSITILSRDGQKKTWAVSLGEIVDEAAEAPNRNSLLWYRLACFLPRELPYNALNGDSPANANRARRDYQLVIRDLGNCPRSRRNF